MNELTEQQREERDQKNILVLSERGEREMSIYARTYMRGWRDAASTYSSVGDVEEPGVAFMEDVLADLVESGDSDVLGMLPFSEVRRIIRTAAKEVCG